MFKKRKRKNEDIKKLINENESGSDEECNFAGILVYPTLLSL